MWSDNETTQDLLGFKIHADLIVDLIKDDSLLPITIGVFGDWGSGKSSILKMIHEDLVSLEDGTFVLYFNGWVFESYDDAKAALIESIIRAFEENKVIAQKIKEKTQKLLKSVNWIRVLGFSAKNIILPAAGVFLSSGSSIIPFLANALSQVNPQELLSKIKDENLSEYLHTLIKEKKQENDPILIREFRDDFADLVNKTEIKKLIVLIDDLDRCTPDRIIENLEAIKLFLNVPKTAFIIGADPRIVKHAIEFRYKEKVEDSNERIVEDYLEKLIQVPYFLPKLSDSEVETYISLLMCKKELSNDLFSKVVHSFQTFREKNKYSVYGLSDIKNFFREENIDTITNNLGSIPALSSIICQSLYGNPRQIKRFLNTFILRKKLADIAGITDFDNSILIKLMILEYSELSLFNTLYEWQVTQNGKPKEIKEIELICKNKNKLRISNELKTSSYTAWDKVKIINLLSKEPYLQDVDLRDYFWIARDKLNSVIPGSSLIPPKIKSLFNELKENITPSITESIIKEKISPLPHMEQLTLLGLCCDSLLNNPKNKRFFDIFHGLIDLEIVDSDSYLIKAMQSIKLNEIEPGEGVYLQKYKNHKVLGPFLSEYFSRNSKAPASRAFNLEE